jgi:FAD/FMN-containing dehydrogenase
MVDGLGRLRRVSATQDPDLFWAVRGGGGAFGIITRIEIDLHPAPPTIYGGRLLWPVEAMPQVLRAFVAVSEQAPPALSVWYHTYRFPPLPDVPEPLRGNAFASVAFAYLGNAEAVDDVLAPLHGIPGLVMDLTGDLPIAALGSIADEPTEPMPALKHSALLDRVDDVPIDRLTAAVGADSDCALTVFQIRHLGAAFAATSDGQGSHGPVAEPYVMWAFGVPVAPEVGAAIMRSFAAMDAASEGYASGRTLLNFLGVGGDPGQWWSPQTRARLARVKATSDPCGLIVSNRPVEPGV